MLSEFTKFAGYAAAESGKIIQHYFRTHVDVDIKSDESPVTIADKKAEELLRTLIMKEFPEHGIIGEEFGNHNPDAEYVWVLDPIDGTKSFVCGTVTFGTLIALLHKGEPVLGVIHQPVLHELLIGDNKTAMLNGNPVSMRSCNNVSDSVLLVTDHVNIKKYQNIEKFETLIEEVKIYRNWGDCYGYYLLATGYADIMVDAIMNLWDVAALVPIVKGAGGIITDYKGGSPLTGDGAIAAHPAIHAEVIKRLNG